MRLISRLILVAPLSLYNVFISFHTTYCEISPFDIYCKIFSQESKSLRDSLSFSQLLDDGILVLDCLSERFIDEMRYENFNGKSTFKIILEQTMEFFTLKSVSYSVASSKQQKKLQLYESVRGSRIISNSELWKRPEEYLKSTFLLQQMVCCLTYSERPYSGCRERQS